MISKETQERQDNDMSLQDSTHNPKEGPLVAHDIKDWHDAMLSPDGKSSHVHPFSMEAFVHMESFGSKRLEHMLRSSLFVGFEYRPPSFEVRVVNSWEKANRYLVSHDFHYFGYDHSTYEYEIRKEQFTDDLNTFLNKCSDCLHNEGFFSRLHPLNIRVNVLQHTWGNIKSKRYFQLQVIFDWISDRGEGERGE